MSYKTLRLCQKTKKGSVTTSGKHKFIQKANFDIPIKNKFTVLIGMIGIVDNSFDEEQRPRIIIHDPEQQRPKPRQGLEALKAGAEEGTNNSFR